MVQSNLLSYIARPLSHLFLVVMVSEMGFGGVPLKKIMFELELSSPGTLFSLGKLYIALNRILNLNSNFYVLSW